LPPQSPGFAPMHYAGQRVVNPDGSSYVYPPPPPGYSHAHMVYPHASYQPGASHQMPPLVGPGHPPVPYANASHSSVGPPPLTVIAAPVDSSGTPNQDAFPSVDDHVKSSP
jgi:hypothetical protein